jgi:hypothetical protein
VPDGADLDTATANVSTGVVAISLEDGRRLTLPLEPIGDDEKAALGEALQDAAVYELLKAELEARFSERGDEPITEAHMAELYQAARNRLFLAVETGELDGLAKTEIETILARTMLRMRTDFGLPAFGLIDNPDSAPARWQCGNCGAFNEGNDLSAACSACGERGDGTTELADLSGVDSVTVNGVEHTLTKGDDGDTIDGEKLLEEWKGDSE